MPIVTETEVNGFQTCSRDRLEHGDCPGYESRPARLLVEEVVQLFGDQHSDWSDAYARIPSLSHSYLRTVGGELTGICEFCGSPTHLSLEPRPVYLRLSDRGPEELVRAREAERSVAERETASLALQDRAAIAAERDAAAAEERNQLDRRRIEVDEERNRLHALELDRRDTPARKPPAKVQA